MHMKERDKLIDVLKGVGIVSVVVGHAGALHPALQNVPSIGFVYLYHLMVFFFVGGMLHRPGKYANAYEYMAHQFKSLLPLYLGYNFAYLLLHNVFVKLNMLNAELYTLDNFIITGCSVPIFAHTEAFAGAMWFVIVLLVAKAIFAAAFDLAGKVRYGWVVHAIVILGTAFVGLYTNSRDMYLLFHIQTAFLAVPVMYLGFLFGRYREKIQGFFHPIVCVVSAAGLLWVLANVGDIELSVNRIISPALFYPVTALGMVFCISLARIIQRIKPCQKLFAYAGKISFHIMGLHFLIFKCFDRIYGAIVGADPQTMGAYPTAYQNMGLVYSLLGVGVSIIVVFTVRKLAAFAKKST